MRRNYEGDQSRFKLQANQGQIGEGGKEGSRGRLVITVASMARLWGCVFNRGEDAVGIA